MRDPGVSQGGPQTQPPDLPRRVSSCRRRVGSERLRAQAWGARDRAELSSVHQDAEQGH